MKKAMLMVVIAACGLVAISNASLSQQEAREGSGSTHSGPVTINNYWGGTGKGGMTRLPGQWVEGEGDLRTFSSASAAVCESACYNTSSCQLAEFYRPEAKCNLFSYRPQVRNGGRADVSIK